MIGRKVALVPEARVRFEPGETVLCVCRGNVLVTVVDQHGNDSLCAYRKQGAVVGLEAVGGCTVNYEIWALGAGTVTLLSAAQLRQRLSRHGGASFPAMQHAVAALCACAHDHATSRGNGRARLARLLLQASGHNVGCSHGACKSMLSLPRVVLARLLGMRPETLSRLLHLFARSGTIELGPPIRVREPERLFRSAGDG